MYTKQETIIIPLILNRIVRKQYHFSWIDREMTFTPIVAVAQKHKYKNNTGTFIRVVLLFPYSSLFSHSCIEVVRHTITEVGRSYGLPFYGCAYSVQEIESGKKIDDFLCEYRTVVFNPSYENNICY